MFCVQVALGRVAACVCTPPTIDRMVLRSTQVVAELNRARTELETEGRATQLGKLCATPFGVDIVGITEFVALIGALVGGKPYDLISAMDPKAGWSTSRAYCFID